MAELLNSRIAGLKKQTGTLPGSLPRTAQAVQSTGVQAMQNQVAAGAAAGVQTSTAQAQQAGAAQTAQKAQSATQVAQQGLQQGLQTGQQSLVQQSGEKKNQLARMSLQLDKESNELANKLEDVQQGLKKELFDRQLEFQQDELGRTVWNERQLLDFQLLKANDTESLRNFEQQFSYFSNLRMQMLKASQAKIQQAMQQSSGIREFEKNAQLQKKLVEAKAALERKIAREKTRQANKAAMFAAAGTIIGAVAGGIATGGNPVGVMAGASVGQGLGSVAASQTK